MRGPNTAVSVASKAVAVAVRGDRILRKSSWIERLSSMTSNRLFLSAGALFIRLLLRRARQFQCEGRALAGAVAVNGQRTAHFFCCQRAAVQAEAVTIFSRRKTVIKDAGQIFRWNPDAIINHGHPDSAITIGHAHR